MTADQHGLSFDPREALSGRLDLRLQSTDRRLPMARRSRPSITPTVVKSGVFWSFPISLD
ncbi:hypothetical protein MTR67_034510, partial [Solanum verrucosum]